MKKITFSLLFSLMCVIGFSQTFPGTGTPTDTQNGNGNDLATCGTADELNLTVAVTGIGILGTTNILDQVDIDITHTWDGDVNVTLIAPDGTTTVDLTSGNGGSGDDYTGTQFRDDAATAITAGAPPFTGPHQPEESLGTFNGVDADGTWTLNFCDSANGDTGTFNSWSITFAPAPTCLDPTGIMDTASSPTDTTISWSPGGSEMDWTYEWGTTGFTPGTGTMGTVMTTPSLAIGSLTGGTLYDIYITANCGGGDGDSGAVLYTWRQPNVGDSCSLPIMATVETDCSVATPNTIDYSTAADLGTGFASCDAVGVNTGAWFEFTTTATGAITLNMSDSNEYAIYDACGGTEIECQNTITTSAEIILSPTTTYYLAVWKDGATVGTTDVCIEEFTPPTPPECAETPISPADMATGVVLAGAGFDTVTLTWTAPSSGPAPTDYRILFGDTSGALADLGLLGGTATTIDITGLDFATTYYWTIVPLNGASEAVGPCAEWSFTTEDPPPPPANDDCAGAVALTPGAVYGDNPVDGTTFAATESGFTNSCGGVPAFDVWYSVVVPPAGDITIETGPDVATANTGFDSAIEVYSSSDNTCAGTLTSIECDDDDAATGLFSIVSLTGLTPGDTLFIRVWEFNNDEFEPFSISAYSATLGIDDVDNAAAFSYYPNPVKNTLTLNAQNNIENVTMYNMLGQEVLRVNPNNVDSTIDMSGIANGSYFVKVTIANITQTVRIIKQ